MTVLFIIIAYNEEKTLGTLLEDIKKQNYPHEKVQIILIDGMSTDNTKEIMQRFADEDNGFMGVIIENNPQKVLPCGWNVALSQAKNDLIIRVDAHSAIPEDFISKNVHCIKSGEKICGGYRQSIIDKNTPWKQTLLLAETSMFGSSIAPYRRNSEKRYVKSVFHGAYCKEVFDTVGKYNEKLIRTEDNEMHFRMRKAGYKICFYPEIISYQYARNNLKKMLQQKYQNGFWIGKTALVSPKCLQIYHFVPFAFMIGIIVTTLLAISGLPLMAYLMWGSYWLLTIIMSIIAIIKAKNIHLSLLTLPVLFLMMHLSYGLGTLVSFLKPTT